MLLETKSNGTSVWVEESRLFYENKSTGSAWDIPVSQVFIKAIKLSNNGKFVLIFSGDKGFLEVYDDHGDFIFGINGFYGLDFSKILELVQRNRWKELREIKRLHGCVF